MKSGHRECGHRPSYPQPACPHAQVTQAPPSLFKPRHRPLLRPRLALLCLAAWLSLSWQARAGAEDADAAATSPASATATATAKATATAAASAPAAVETGRLLELVNTYRASRSLLPLQHDASLQVIAEANSGRMLQLRRLSHDGFDQRFRQTGGRVCVENLAVGFRREEDLLAGWQASPGHDRNLLDGRVSHAGIGEVQGYVTLMACRLGPR